MTVICALTDGNDTTYDVTECPACNAYTALTITPGVYVCAGCGQTGDAGDWINTPHDQPNETAREAFRQLHVQSRVVKDFTRYSVRHTKARKEREAHHA